MIGLFLALYGFDWRRISLRMEGMDWHIHYYIYLMSRRVDCMVSDNDDEISEHGSLRFSRIIIQDKNIWATGR